ncbi:protein FAM162A [Phascolarctos cinereus]|uniref:Protein FAM162A n=1 Tax=Phascolarctos cinereus TaxID=38626 RepID=A0A6P5K7Y5_PHACI|nr:protein FAM162A [Phascolarctos cinereus]
MGSVRGLCLAAGNCLRLCEREVFPSLRLARKGDLKMMKGFCTKPQENSKAPSRTSAVYKCRVPLHKPTAWEKKLIVWSGRFKREDEIPETISLEMLDAAKNRVRIKISYIMIALTVMGCILMIFQGKQAAKRHETLTNMNLEKKARLRKEAEEALESKTE